MHYLVEGYSPVEVAYADLNSVVLTSKFATVYNLEVVELPQASASQLGIVNITGWSKRNVAAQVALCVMLVGKDSEERILWSCCLSGQNQTDQPSDLIDSLLVSQEILGKTRQVTILLYGCALSSG